MNRSTQNFPSSENRRSIEDNRAYPARRTSWSGTRPLFPPYVPATVVLVTSTYRQNPGIEVQGAWPLFQERVTSSSFEVGQFPGVQYVPNQTLLPENDITTSFPRQRRPPFTDAPDSDLRLNIHASREGSRLTAEEQKDALNKLKKETYYPMPKRSSKMPNLYYRDYDINHNKEANMANDEDGKRCAICLEDFVPREVVTVTPCKHMFHEDCIVPWVKSQGKCPVCRFAIYEKMSVNNASSNNANTDNAFESDMLSMIRAMDQPFISERRRLFLP